MTTQPQSTLRRIRYWLIERLVGEMPVVMNCHIEGGLTVKSPYLICGVSIDGLSLQKSAITVVPQYRDIGPQPYSQKAPINSPIGSAAVWGVQKDDH